MLSAVTDVADVYTRAKYMMSQSQATIDAMSQFMTARAALEEGFAKNMRKLANASLAVNGAPLFGAILGLSAMRSGGLSLPHLQL